MPPQPIDFAIAWAIVIGTVGAFATVFTLVRAKIKTSTPSTTDSAELTDLRDAVRRLDGEVGDLTERLDFAERLLAKQRDAERVRGDQ